jgi:hypothetical protein
MGVESDHLVYDYLSRVGDLAHNALPADQRMRLVTELRRDIDLERGRSGSGDDEGTVRRILGKLGTPEEVVKAAAGRPLPRRAGEARDAAQPAGDPEPSVPEPSIPLPRDQVERSGSASAGEEPQWWRVPGQRSSAARTNELLAGWSGGLLPPEPGDEEEQGQGEAEAGEPDREAEAKAAGPGRLRRVLGARRRRAAPQAEAVVVRRKGLPVGPIELLAALALIAGVVVGSWWALGVGWLIAYTTRGLTRAEAKWAALGMPGLVAGGALVWLWGRTDRRWGPPLDAAQLGPLIAADYPVVVRVAAVASAVFLLWRSSTRR